MKLQSIKKGFTLIELLVVITIIGILATGGTAIYTSQIQKARDSTRVTSINALKGAVEQVYQDEFEYPHANTFVTEVSPYLENMPSDPKHAQPCNNINGTVDCWFAYVANVDTNGILFGSFELSTAFENQGNVTSKAERWDNWNDDARLEIGSLTSTNNTTVALDGITAAPWACNLAWSAYTSDTWWSIVIINGNPSSGQCG